MTEGLAARVLDAALMLCAQEGQATADAIAAYVNIAPDHILPQLNAWAAAGQLHARPGGVFTRAVIGSAWATINRKQGGTYATDLGLPTPAQLMAGRA